MTVKHDEPDIRAPRFKDALREGEVIEKSGYHQPQNAPYHRQSCGCDLTTEKGAYRDVTVKMPGGWRIHYYHQSPVVVEKYGLYRLSSCGYKTSTTKERINRYAPVRVFQRDFEWYVSDDGEEVPFEDGMVVEP